MAEEPRDLVLEILSRVDRRLENVEMVVIDTRARLQSVEDQMVLLRQDVVRIDHLMDGFDSRLQRIERRLDLIEA